MHLKPYLLEWELWKKYGWGRAYQVALKGRPKEHKNRGSLTYGETPRAVMEKIKCWSQISSEDLFLELGSGTGQFALWLAISTQCEAVGIDVVAPFIHNANAIAKKLSISAQFFVADVFDYSWSDADLIYLTATCFSDDQMARIVHKVDELKEGAKLVVLTHQIKLEELELRDMWIEDFSWGVATVFLYEKR